MDLGGRVLQLLECLDSNLTLDCGSRVLLGGEVPLDTDKGWVRLISVQPVTGFPAVPPVDLRCGGYFWTAQVEVGVARCYPTGDGVTSPDPVEETNASLQLVNDLQAIISAWECCMPSYAKVGLLPSRNRSGGGVSAVVVPGYVKL